VLSCADAHIYLTEPFIASWSMVDAMACGAVLIASDQNCVREYVVPGENGLLVNFFDHEKLADQTLEVLGNLPAYQPLRDAAMRTVTEKFSLDVAMPRIKDLFERVAAKPRVPSVLLEKLVRKGTIEVVTTDPEALARKARVTESPSGAGAGAGAPDSGGDAIAGQTPQERAINMVKSLGQKARTVPDWVHTALAFDGPKPGFEALGPRNHPIDLERLLRRLAEWKAKTLVEIGVQEGGTLFLFAQMAEPDARLVVAAGNGSEIPAERIPLLNAMARPRQTIVAIPKSNDLDDLKTRLLTALAGQSIDFLFLHGRRPYRQVAAEFRTFSKLVRSGGLIAWDGITPVTAFGPDREGGHRLYVEVQPQYPQRAEYLNGAATEYGGITMVKV
jgi:hypothetical protein